MIAASDVPPSPIQIDAWVYGVIGTMLMALMFVALVTFLWIVDWVRQEMSG